MGLVIMILGLAVFIGAHGFTTFLSSRAAPVPRLTNGEAAVRLGAPAWGAVVHIRN